MSMKRIFLDRFYINLQIDKLFTQNIIFHITVGFISKFIQKQSYESK